MLAKRFFYVCAGLLCLMLAYHLGARSATAQSGQTAVGVMTPGNQILMVTQNGDTFLRGFASGNPLGGYDGPVIAVGNFWGGGVTPATEATWGQVKARYRQGVPAAPENK